jgi:hypothetical protein
MWVLQTYNDLLNIPTNVSDEKYNNLYALGVICHLGFALNTKHFRKLFSFYYETKDWDRHTGPRLKSKAEKNLQFFLQQTSAMDNDKYQGTDFTRHMIPQIKSITVLQEQRAKVQCRQ